MFSLGSGGLYILLSLAVKFATFSKLKSSTSALSSLLESVPFSGSVSDEKLEKASLSRGQGTPPARIGAGQDGFAKALFHSLS